MFLGLDISKLNFDAALLDPSVLLDPSRPDTKEGGKPRHRAFPNTPAGFERLQEWLGDCVVHACLEATGTYGEALARFLHERGHTVSVVNPARVKGFGQAQMTRTKTDKADTKSWPPGHTRSSSPASACCTGPNLGRRPPRNWPISRPWCAAWRV